MIARMLTSGLLAAAVLTHPRADRPVFDVVDLGITIRTIDQGPVAINDRGEIVGAMDVNERRSVAFHWARGRLRALATPADAESHAQALNNRGQIAGIVAPTGGPSRGVIWQARGARPFRPSIRGGLGAGDGSGQVTFVGISDDGAITGSVFLGEEVCQGFVQKGNQPIRPPAGTGEAWPFPPTARSRSGALVGSRGPTRADTTITGMICDRSGVREIGMLPGGVRCRPTSVNSRGQVVGTATADGVYAERAFLWTEGSMRQLPTPEGAESAAAAINDRGDVVGWADLPGDATLGGDTRIWAGERAILWTHGQARTLNDLIDPKAGWDLERAVAINNRGWIIGVGRHRPGSGAAVAGEWRGFLLVPRAAATSKTIRRPYRQPVPPTATPQQAVGTVLPH